jgi:hypothetical protein
MLKMMYLVTTAAMAKSNERNLDAIYLGGLCWSGWADANRVT